jgi:hypothetical protein
VPFRGQRTRRHAVVGLASNTAFAQPPTAMPPGSPAESPQAILALSATPTPAETSAMPSNDSLMGLAGLL